MPGKSQSENDSGIVKGLADEYTSTTELNRLAFLVKTLMRDISTAIPVIIMSVQAGDTQAAGYVDAKPLIAHVDAWGDSLPMATLHHLPYFRLQAGRAGVVLDPVVGDIGLAVFAQSDCSTLKQGQSETAQPGSWRKFDEADGFYIGGFLNTPIDTYVRLAQDGSVTIKAPGSATIDAPTVTYTGDIICGGFSYLQHTHTGVHGETSPPH
jgi:hypothetical protein